MGPVLAALLLVSQDAISENEVDKECDVSKLDAELSWEVLITVVLSTDP